ncbi:preprotein translocase subunit YajC [Oceanispirochaeta crateris]|jgi:preprotein translocase subunit YajC|uniref:Sec translocon accessory complex subunit YajC n=1 Tax=Oceanispirochaeta crateris TaxID=2518645 RepID=A0A5C1QMN8_9SPIO|nr:preprotein translocase subunit YajC [Oceanispirochaeta crateris]QEN07422.1 preprotein translocase subunit YajC [Oceanispirochaeta crateris]
MDNFRLALLMGMPAGGSSGSTGGSMTTSLVTFALVIGIFYFLIIRPQNKKQKETKNMIEAVKKNDKIITIGGIRGTVHAVKEETVIIKVDDECKLEINKSAISTVLNAVAEPKNEKGKKDSKKAIEEEKK